MNRRIIGLALSAVFALVGTFILVAYVNAAEARAVEGEELVPVLVVTKAVPAGTPAEELGKSVTTEEVPAKVRASGAVSDLDELEGKVTTVNLIAGEQLVEERFGETVERVGVPAGLLEVTVKLDPERAMGGALRPGDKVAVLSSFDPFEIDASGIPGAAPGAKKTPNMTHLILHKVLVTRVQISEGTAGRIGDGGDDEEETAPAGTLLVTLALDAESVQRVVFTAEHGTLWLSAQPSEAPEGALPIETLGTVNR